MRIAVTGDRNWPGTRYQEIFKRLQALRPGSIVILGDATGVDSLARQACVTLGLTHSIYEADWNTFGKGAGPIRNKEMLDAEPEEVWYWHRDLSKSKGTKNMLAQAKERGIPTINMTEESP
jgi:hypothetical protein